MHSRNDEIEREPEAGDTTNASEGEEDTKAGITDEQMQTFVFSATLSKDLQQNLKKRKHARAAKGKPASTLGMRFTVSLPSARTLMQYCEKR